MMRSWLARLTFSFFIIGFFLAWEGYQGAIGRMPMPQWRILFYFIVAMLSFVLGFTGLRARHHSR